MNIRTYLKQHIHQAITQVVGETGLAVEAIHLEHPADATHGDFATNTALHLFGKLKATGEMSFESPRALAQALVEELQAATAEDSQSPIADISIAGPGFINFVFTEAFLISQIGEIIQNGLSTTVDSIEGQKIITEYTDPNPFKVFHIGHLYSNVVGESLSRLYEAAGADVHRVCYQGDVGMHVAKSIWGLIKKLDDDGIAIEAVAADQPAGEQLKARLDYLGQAYALGATAYKEDEHAQEAIKQINLLVYLSAQQRLVEDEGWEPQVDYQELLASEIDQDYFARITELYRVGRAWSLAYFDTIYQRLGTEFEAFFFESFAGEYGLKIVRDFLAKGVFEESQGAVIFPGEQYGLHNRVFVNSMGLPTYEAKELALPTLKDQFMVKQTGSSYDVSIIVTGNEIDEYFKVLLTTLSKTNPELAEKTHHVSHGMVMLPSGKMSSRTGNVVSGEQLLNEAATRAAAKIQELDQGNPAEVAEKVGKAAVKFVLLKSNVGKDVVLDFDEALNFQGATGPYLQYTAVRGKSILAKAATAADTPIFDHERYIAEHFDIENTRKAANLHPTENDLLRNLYTYSEVVEAAVTDHAPHHVATYLTQVAQLFNVFYGQVPILQSEGEERAFRLALTLAVVKTIEHGLWLLGIESVEKM